MGASDLLPYPYQRRLATAENLPSILSVPTGVGKTAAAILAWLSRRRFASPEVKRRTPRRLIYCLPMRTLVDQTANAAGQWLTNLKLDDPQTGIQVHRLMGGHDSDDWFKHPERDAILIGTQDMLLSRALNRGYGMSRYQWPVDFALLNNDCLWVLDETQLMGVGLTTSAQLAGLRSKLNTYGRCHTLWMSATLDPEGINTVDHPRPDGEWPAIKLDDDDLKNAGVRRLIEARKPIAPAATSLTGDSVRKGYEASLAKEVLAAHQPGTITLVVLNRVVRAQAVFSAVNKLLKEQPGLERFLIHSRFRPHDRSAAQLNALDEKTVPPQGRIVIATQAIEAGVDLSATTLFTELAPWSSLVQRFGRCNRRGVCGLKGCPPANVFWIDIECADEKSSKDRVLPYTKDQFDRARDAIAEVTDVGPQTLATVAVEEPRPIVHVLRRKDLLDLFDTTPDLSGNDLDVSRYIRESDDTDAQIYWREWDHKSGSRSVKPPQPKTPDGAIAFPAPQRNELCSVSVAALRGKTGFIKKAIDRGLPCYVWDPLDKEWSDVKPDAVRPGMTILFHCSAGGYDTVLGWTGDPTDRPGDVHEKNGDVSKKNAEPEIHDADDLLGRGKPLTLTKHLADVAAEAEGLKSELSTGPTTLNADLPWSAIVRAAWWHDVGKAHPAFQTAMRDADAIRKLTGQENQLWAKSGETRLPFYRILKSESEEPERRRGFRHELASALAWIRTHGDEPDAGLIAYLIASHHGKVRLSIRSMPNERGDKAHPKRLFARGIWDGDPLPAFALGNGDELPETALDLRPMQLGETEGRPCWLARTLALRSQFGPFQLAYLETLLRVADWRGSAAGEHRS